MRFETPVGALNVEILQLTIAGWTGRDAAAVAHHIDELAQLGVAPPSRVPLFYRAAPTLLTQAAQIQVLGSNTSGEVEPFLLRANGALWLGLASDHTDRDLESHSVAASKQICTKPVGARLWPFESLAGCTDHLQLRCEIEEEGNWVTYQSGSLEAIQPLAALLAMNPLAEGDAMLCGTLAALGGVRPAQRYHMSLLNMEQSTELSLSYSVSELPIVQ